MRACWNAQRLPNAEDRASDDSRFVEIVGNAWMADRRMRSGPKLGACARAGYREPWSTTKISHETWRFSGRWPTHAWRRLPPEYGVSVDRVSLGAIRFCGWAWMLMSSFDKKRLLHGRRARVSSQRHQKSLMPVRNSALVAQHACARRKSRSVEQRAEPQ